MFIKFLYSPVVALISALALAVLPARGATDRIILGSPSTVLVGSVVPFAVSLSSPAPSGGVTITLTSSNYSIFTLLSTVTIPAGATTPQSTPQIWGMADGKATLTASASKLTGAAEVIDVKPETGVVTVDWSGARWEYLTLYGVKGNYQAMGYTLDAPVPMTLNATLFFKDNCDPSAGQDNMNDFDLPTYPGSGIQGFSHHPNLIPSSAIYWFGVPTSNGLCPSGAPCSGCVNYTKNTPGWVNP
jgi:hypothetical protein